MRLEHACATCVNLNRVRSAGASKQMEHEEHPETRRDKEKRRKIIKGMAGLPAIMTLASGSASALDSSPLACAVDPDNNDPNNFVDGRNPFTVTRKGNNGTKCDNRTGGNAFTDAERARSPDVLVCKTNRSGSDFDQQRNIGWADSGDYSAAGSNLGSDYFDAGPGTPVREDMGGGKYRMIFVRHDGVEFNWTNSSGNRMPVTASCLASIRAYKATT